MVNPPLLYPQKRRKSEQNLFTPLADVGECRRCTRSHAQRESRAGECLRDTRNPSAFAPECARISSQAYTHAHGATGVNTPMVGRTLHRYRIVEEVGHGGMAVVYRGVDEALERDVAVKLLHPHLAARVEHRKRLAREARAVARLRHPNILEIYDFSGEDSPEAFLVTELIVGRTLRAFAVEHPFDPPELAAACVYVLAGALAHAHEQGIIHRDLKPDNVMVHEAGDSPIIKLMDFGIAQIIDRDERMTMTGSLIGSPSHMAPEIIDGEDADERSDIFSLGTVLYAIVTGQLPFEAPSPGALLKKILSGDYPDPREIKPTVSDALTKVIHDSMALNPADRIQNASAFQARLRDALLDVEIERPEELLERFLKDPQGTATSTRDQIVRTLMRQGYDATRTKRPGKALQSFSRVIAIVPGTGEAGEARQAIDKIKRRGAWRKRFVAAGAFAVVGIVALLAGPWMQPPPPPTASAHAAEPEVAITAVETPVPDYLLRQVVPMPAPDDFIPAIAAVVRPKPKEAVPEGQSQLRTPARLSIHVKDVWARVLIDGVHRGQTPYEAETAAGTHRIRLESDCCRPVDFDTTLAPGETREERHVLDPLPASLQIVVSGPSDAGIMLDDQFEAYASELKGKPLSVPMLRNGSDWRYDRTVRVRIFSDGFVDEVSEVRLRAGQSRRIEFTLGSRT